MLHHLPVAFGLLFGVCFGTTLHRGAREGLSQRVLVMGGVSLMLALATFAALAATGAVRV